MLCSEKTKNLGRREHGRIPAEELNVGVYHLGDQILEGRLGHRQTDTHDRETEGGREREREGGREYVSKLSASPDSLDIIQYFNKVSVCRGCYIG